MVDLLKNGETLVRRVVVADVLLTGLQGVIVDHLGPIGEVKGVA